MRGLTQSVVVSLCVITAVGLFSPIRGRSAAQAARANDETAQLLAQYPLGPLFGKQVLIGGAYVPENGKQGKLETADDTWIRIRGKNGQLYCFPAAQLAFVVLAEDVKP